MKTVQPSAILVALALATTASAQTTWVVDDDGGLGVDFLNIQDALDVATPFDLVDVMPGSYPRFTMSSPTRVMGRAGAEVSGETVIRTISSGQWSLVADLKFSRLKLEQSAGTIVLDGVECLAGNNSLVVTDCDDVRTNGFVARFGGSPSGPKVNVTSSRVQFEGAVIRATSFPSMGDNGQTAIRASDNSFLHLTSCQINGGRGADGVQLLFFYEPGDGGEGVSLSGGSEARISRSTIVGGVGGFDPVSPFVDGYHGSGVYQCGGASRAWDSVIEAGFDPSSVAPIAPPYALECGATLSTSLDLPEFRILGTALPLGAVTLEAAAEIGTSIRIIMGRFPVIAPVPSATLPRLVDIGRLGSLGAIPASGLISVPLPLPNWSRGTVLFLQASRTDTVGVTDFSNSTVLLVR